jgi:hypothetical protein
MRSLLFLFIIAFAQCIAPYAHAEFIGNAFGGEPENATRAAASRVFQAYQIFYSGMSSLEQRNVDQAQGRFREALSLFQQGKADYERAANLLAGRPFNLAKLEATQQQILLQFLGPFGANPTSDQASILKAYAVSFERTSSLISGDPKLSLVRFREIQAFIGRQILVGTLISQIMQT